MNTFDFAIFVVYAIYGSSFLVMAVVVWKRLERTARMGLVKPLTGLIVFAAFHGFGDLVEVVLRVPGFPAQYVIPFRALKIALISASFISLLLFGVSSFVRSRRLMRLVLSVGVVGLVGVTATIVAIWTQAANAGDSTKAVEIAVRHLIAVPAAVLSAAAFFRVAVLCRRLGMRQSAFGAIVAGAFMAVYAVLAGVFVSGSSQPYILFGLPIQVYRMTAAIGITIGVAWMLERMTIGARPTVERSDAGRGD